MFILIEFREFLINSTIREVSIIFNRPNYDLEVNYSLLLYRDLLIIELQNKNNIKYT